MSKKRHAPEKLAQRLNDQFGRKAFEVIEKAYQTPRIVTFRVNTIKSTEEEIMNALRKDRIAFERVKQIPGAFIVKNIKSKELLNLPICKEGKIYVQGLSSMIPPLLLDPKPGESVLDLCAAPGSKTSQIAALMNGQGKITAIEKDPVRFQKLEHTLNLQSTNNVDAIEADATRELRDNPIMFDKILADVPCSAEGRIDLFSPRTFRYWSERNITAHAKLQRSLLRSAAPHLKPGGTLVYSTCTLAPQENEDLINWFLSEHPDFEVIKTISPLHATWIKNGHYLLPNNKHEGLFVSTLTKKQ
jgi:16S rRNA C967 or C1407 C5-methylase (RsmB/RsmF family)